MLSDQLKAQISLITKANAVDKDLLTAIVQVESAGNVWAMRYEPAWKHFVEPQSFAVKLRISFETEKILQASSFGLCQVMGGVCRELGYSDDLPKLFQEDINILYGTKKLKKLMNKYAKESDVIAAYNAGIPKLMSNRKYFNQPYVDKVTAFLKILRGQNEMAKP